MAKTEIGKWLEVKDNVNQPLKRQLAQQQDQTQQQIEKVQELEDYIIIQVDYFADQLAAIELQKEAKQELHEEEKRHLELGNTDLTRICASSVAYPLTFSIVLASSSYTSASTFVSSPPP